MEILSLETTGIKGGKNKLTEKIGKIVALPTDNINNYISVDAYEGYGNTYAKRETNLIQIVDDGNLVFSGSFTELVDKLKSK